VLLSPYPGIGERETPGTLGMYEGFKIGFESDTIMGNAILGA